VSVLVRDSVASDNIKLGVPDWRGRAGRQRASRSNARWSSRAATTGSAWAHSRGGVDRR